MTPNLRWDTSIRQISRAAARRLAVGCLRATVLFVFGVTGAFAHHSDSMFDKAKERTVEGTVKEFQWTNPHVWLQVMVPDGKGGVIEEGFEVGSPNTMIRDGWRKDSFVPGDKVTVISHPRRDGSPGGALLVAQKPGGPALKFGIRTGQRPPNF